MGFFDFNNPQHQQLANAHSTGDYSQLDPQQVVSAYQGFVNHGPEAEVQQVHQDYFKQMPQVERMGLFSSLINTVQQNGIDPRQAGVSTTDPQQASPLDLSNLFNLARSSGLLDGMFGGGRSQSGLGALAGLIGGNQSGSTNQGGFNNQQPNPVNNQNQGGLAGILNNPIAQAALGGLVSYAANRAFGGNTNQPTRQMPSDQSLPYQQNPSDQSLPYQQAQSGLQNPDLPPAPQSDFRM